MSGDETIYSGIRPLGFHPGNMIVLSVYPHLVAENLQNQGKKPRFSYIITMNDIEPARYDFERFIPLDTSVSFKEDISITEKTIRKALTHMLDDFPEINVSFVKSSSFQSSDKFSDVADILINHKEKFAKSYIKPEYLDGKTYNDMHFIGIICDDCHSPLLSTSYNNALFEAYCESCDKQVSGIASEMNFWLYYVNLISMKLSILQPDIVLLGGDYIQTPDERIKSLTKANPLGSIMNFYDWLGGRSLNFLLGPLLIGEDGRKMSKEFNNIQDLSYEDVFSFCKSQCSREVRFLK
ncbi:MAG: hypothetical protein Q7R97_05255 [Candidatus Daviesbacteria bacterium]|nr:hypothetical protein [Candidatus Daviesbacteria bacterium]